MSAFELSLTSYIPKIKTSDGFIATEPFLDTCRQVLPVVDKLGTAFALVRTDVGGNIERLGAYYAKDPERYARLFTIVQDEIVCKQHLNSTSCTKGLLWLKRAMEFILALLTRLHDDPTSELTTVVAHTYNATLAKYHGFMVSTAFTLAFKFVPSRESFLAQLGPREALLSDMHAYTTSLSAVLAEIHTYLGENGLDDPSKV